MGSQSILNTILLTKQKKPEYFSGLSSLSIRSIDTEKRGRDIVFKASIGRDGEQFYDTFLSLPEDDLKLSSTEWKGRVGSDQKWEPKPPQNIIKSIYKENNAKWTKEQKENHRNRKNLYASVSEYNAKEKGINADFIFRFSEIYFRNKHLLGEFNYSSNLIEEIKEKTMDRVDIIIYPRHILKLITFIMESGILKNQ
jgi:hypothetical protein